MGYRLISGGKYLIKKCALFFGVLFVPMVAGRIIIVVTSNFFSLNAPSIWETNVAMPNIKSSLKSDFLISSINFLYKHNVLDEPMIPLQRCVSLLVQSTFLILHQN